jgi:hypothetical protein
MATTATTSGQWHAALLLTCVYLLQTYVIWQALPRSFLDPTWRGQSPANITLPGDSGDVERNLGRPNPSTSASRHDPLQTTNAKQR